MKQPQLQKDMKSHQTHVAIDSSMNQMLKSTTAMEPHTQWEMMEATLSKDCILCSSTSVFSDDVYRASCSISFIYRLHKQIISTTNLSSLAFAPILTLTHGGFILFRDI